MTDLQKREADIQDNEGMLLEDAPNSPTVPDSPLADSQSTDVEPPAAEPEEPLPDALAA